LKTENLKENSDLKEVRILSDRFAHEEGRRPRIMISEPKSDSETDNTKQQASLYADMGFDVDISVPFENIKNIVKQAIESDVHILCISITSTHDWIPKIIEEFNRNDKTEVIVILLADLPEQDRTSLLKTGTTAIFTRDLATSRIAKEILEILMAN